MKEDGVIVPHLPREVFPEYYLVRVNVYDKLPETPLDEWMTYLKTGKVKDNTRTPGLQEVKKKLQYLSMSPKERRAYEEHMDAPQQICSTLCAKLMSGTWQTCPLQRQLRAISSSD